MLENHVASLFGKTHQNVLLY